MTGGIAYDGVESAGGGNIFDGKKFWVAQRVPMRTHFVDMIKTNGGTIVPLENRADYLIADHARQQDAPPGSYSYQFIEDSVKNAILQVEDRYLICQPDVARPVGSSAPNKRTRVPFTKAEDAALVEWVLSHHTARTGNAIYQEFEVHNPNHTWQSWRNRWMKSLCNLPQAELERMANLASSLQKEKQPGKTSNRGTRNPSVNGQVAVTTSVDRPREISQERTPAAQEEPEQNHPLQPDEHEDENGRQEGDPREEEFYEEFYAIRDQFYADLEEFAEQKDISIEFQPNIGGRTIDLFALAQTVDLQDVPPEQVDWNVVAGKMRCNPRSRDVVYRLQRCYEDNLSAFLAAMDEYEKEQEHSQLGEGEQQGDQCAADVHSPGSEKMPDLPSDPPSGARRKRSLEDEDIITSSRSKRRKLDRDAEIPSTPDHVLKVVRNTPRAAQDVSPTARRRVAAALAEIKDSQDDTQATLPPPRTPNGRTSAYKSGEPGQDVSRTPRLDTQQSTFDVTPSQQLRSEDRLTISPADRGRRDQPTSSSEPIPEEQQTCQRTRDLGSGSHQIPDPPLSPSAPPRRTKAARRTLPPSFAGHGTHAAQPARTSLPSGALPSGAAAAGRERSPDAHDPANHPDPRPRRDSPNFNTIEGWVEHYQAMGYPHDIVVTALKVTTLTPGGTASHVMESLRSGQGLPQNYEGVWTDRDDRSLRLVVSAGDLDRNVVDAQESQVLKKARRERARLLHKHREERMNVRKAFLEAQDQEEGSA